MINRGIAGGVIEQTAFKEHFLNNENQVNQEGATDITGNIVAVLQAGAFFGALGSASISREYLPSLKINTTG